MLTKEERLREAMRRVRARGYEVAPGAYGVGFDPVAKKWRPQKSAGKRMCPLGALVVVEQPPLGEPPTVTAAAARLLGVDARWLVCFCWKFDGRVDACVCEACELGGRFHAEIAAPKISP